MLELYTRPVLLADAPSIVPADPAGLVLVPGRPQDFASLAKGGVSRYPLWRTILSGPARSREEECWYRALVGIVAEAIDIHPDALHWKLKRDAGKILGLVFIEEHGLQYILKSSTQMDYDEFHTYVLIATEILFKQYLPEIRRRDVLRRVWELTGISPPRA